MRHLAMALAAVLLLGGRLAADERLFGYSYEADVLPKGGLEFEQWITNKNGKAVGVFSRFDLRQELELGLTDRLTASLYLNSKSVYESVTDEDPLSPTFGTDINTEEFAFEGVSNEWKYRILSPYEHWLGVLGYAEFGYNGPELELEGKLVLQHNFSDALVWVMNFTVENEYVYEASRQSVEGISEFTSGLAWKFLPTASLGLELRNHREWPDNWGWQEHSAWFAGPALHVAGEKFSATLTVLPQITGQPETIPGDGRHLVDHEKVETRLLVGVNF